MNHLRFNEYGELISKDIRGVVATSNDADVIHIFYANDTSTTETAYRTRARLKRADGHTIGPIILTLSTASFDTQAEAETFGLAVYNIETEKWDVACRKLSLTAEMLGVKGDIGISIIYDQVNELGAVLATDVNQMIVAKVYEAVDEILTEEEFNQLVEFFLPRDLGDVTDGNKPDLTQKIVIRQGGETKLITLDQLNSLLEDGVTEFKKVKYDINSPAETLEIGETRWNAEAGTYETRLSTDVYLLHSQELLFKCGNISGKDIANGTAVYISGASGSSSNFYVDKADNINLTKASRMIGLATEEISNNSSGYVCFSGIVNGVNTASFNVEDMLYLSTNGTLTNVRPTGLVVEVGIVIRKHSTSGAVVISPRYYPRLDDLSNVNFTDSAEGDVAIRLANGTYANYNLTNKLNEIDAKDLEQDGRLTTNESNIANLESGTTVIPTYELKANKNVANGYVGLDANKKIPLTYLYDGVLGQLEYGGVFNPSVGYPTDTNSLDTNRPIRKGDYFIANADGTAGGVSYNTGDWAIRSADNWQKIDNTDAVASVNGKLGVVVLDGTDIKVGNGDTATLQARFVAIDALINSRYTKSEVYNKAETDAIINGLKTMYGWEQTLIVEKLAQGSVHYVALTTLATLNEYDFVLFTLKFSETYYTKLLNPAHLEPQDIIFFEGDTYYKSMFVDEEEDTTIRFSHNMEGLAVVDVFIEGIKIAEQKAVNITYDNTTSELTAENVQEAIDELENEIDLGLEQKTDKLETRQVGEATIQRNSDGLVIEVINPTAVSTPLYVDGKLVSLNETYSDGKSYVTTFNRLPDGTLVSINKQEVL